MNLGTARVGNRTTYMTFVAFNANPIRSYIVANGVAFS